MAINYDTTLILVNDVDITSEIDLHTPLDLIALENKYQCNRKDIIISTNGKKQYPSLVKFEGKNCYECKKVIGFEDIEKYKLVYSDYSKIVDSSAIVINPYEDLFAPREEADLIDFYTEIIAKDESEKDQKILSNFFENFNPIRKNSLLGKVLLNKDNQKIDLPSTLIFPFGVNPSQYEAVKNGLSNEFSIIEGPPGTGKTQTILNLIANLVLINKTVAVCSNNNSAIKNVVEKLKKYDCDDYVASLGNKDNIEDFFKALANKETKSLELVRCNITIEKYKAALKKYLEYGKVVYERAQLSEELYSFDKEYELYNDGKALELGQLFRKPNEEKARVLSLLFWLRETHVKNKFGFFDKLRLFFKYRLVRKCYKKDPNILAELLQNNFYELKQKELNNKIASLDNQLKEFDVDTLKQTIEDYSLYCLKSHLKAIDVSLDKTFTQENYRKNFTAFIKRFPIVTSSTYSLTTCTGFNYTYDYLIIDEASQVNMGSAVLSFSKAKAVTVVGDLKQLPQIDNDKLKQMDKDLQRKYIIPKGFNYYGNNILKALKTHFNNIVPSTLLCEHYRCQADIIRFSNLRFYEGRLVCLTKSDNETSHLKLLVAEGCNNAIKNSIGTGFYNEKEIQLIKQDLEQKTEISDIAVISPYRCQVNKLQKSLPEGVDSDTIHKFQGREKEEVYFSTVANNADDYMKNEELITHFVNNENLLNVAITRAKKQFTLVTCNNIYANAKGCLGDLLSYLKLQLRLKREWGKVKPYPEFFYKDYLENYQLSDKEKDALTILNKVLEEKRYSSYAVAYHVALSDIIDLEDIHTFVSFLLYNKIDKRPVMIFELDKENPETKYQININSVISYLTIKDEKDEEKLIRKALDELI